MTVGRYGEWTPTRMECERDLRECRPMPCPPEMTAAIWDVCREEMARSAERASGRPGARPIAALSVPAPAEQTIDEWRDAA